MVVSCQVGAGQWTLVLHKCSQYSYPSLHPPSPGNPHAPLRLHFPLGKSAWTLCFLPKLAAFCFPESAKQNHLRHIKKQLLLWAACHLCLISSKHLRWCLNDQPALASIYSLPSLPCHSNPWPRKHFRGSLSYQLGLRLAWAGEGRDGRHTCQGWGSHTNQQTEGSSRAHPSSHHKQVQQIKVMVPGHNRETGGINSKELPGERSHVIKVLMKGTRD